MSKLKRDGKRGKAHLLTMYLNIFSLIEKLVTALSGLTVIMLVDCFTYQYVEAVNR